MTGTNARGPLGAVGSIKLKLGMLVGASVTVTAVVVALGARGGLSPVITVPVAIGVALVVTQVLARGMTAPLRELADAATRLAAGDYSARVQQTSADEVGELVIAFNRMAADLESVDRGRRELVANVSHELRTPLTALSASLENLADGVVDPSPDRLAAVHAQAQRLSHLVADLMDLSRLDAGFESLTLSLENLSDLVSTAVDEVRSLGRAVTYDLSGIDPTLEPTVDRERFVQLVVGLLDNASRHSPPGGVVTVRARPLDQGWQLEIGDQGPGVGPEERLKVFERYGTGVAAGGGGTGLGLAIARWIVHLHHGTIGFVDPPEGGACLRVELPDTVTPPDPPTQENAGSSRAPQAAGRWSWPELPARTGAGAVFASVVVGVLAAGIFPEAAMGLGVAFVFWSAIGVVWWWTHDRGDRFRLVLFAGAALLVGSLVLRAAPWLHAVSLTAAWGLMLVGASRGTRLLDFVQAVIAWPLSALHGLPWLGRVLGAGSPTTYAVGWLRAVVLGLVAAVGLVALFASGDAVFGSWVNAVTPDWTLPDVTDRVIVAVFVGGTTLAAAYLGINPPAPTPVVWAVHGRSTSRAWLVPLVAVCVVFGMFVAAQGAALFGGRGYVERTTGLTYAMYVHEGFGQMVVATVVALVMMWGTRSLAGGGDARWVNVGVSALGALTLVVVASAIVRMNAYQTVYGYTPLRVLVDVFEVWLGVVVVASVALGWLRRTEWLPSVALVTGALTLILLNLGNPEAYIARENLARGDDLSEVDFRTLKSLSLDAAGVLAGVDRQYLPCVAPERNELRDDSLRDWNLSRLVARGIWVDIDQRGGWEPELCDPAVAETGRS